MIIALLWKGFTPKYFVAGKYVNNNTDYTLEGPKPIQQGYDTLTLFKDGTFSSNTWGNGVYKITDDFLGCEITLDYNYTAGKGSIRTQISRPFFGDLRIWLNHDRGFYFKRIGGL